MQRRILEQFALEGEAGGSLRGGPPQRRLCGDGCGALSAGLGSTAQVHGIRMQPLAGIAAGRCLPSRSTTGERQVSLDRSAVLETLTGSNVQPPTFGIQS